TRPLLDGIVEPQGVELTTMTYKSPERDWRTIRGHEFDAAEVSLGSHVARVSRGYDDMIGIPAYPHRRFRHGFVFVPANSAVRNPAELKNGTIGLRTWANTAAVWMKGILEEHYELPVSSV